MNDVLQRVEEIERQQGPSWAQGQVAQWTWLCQQVRRLVEERDEARRELEEHHGYYQCVSKDDANAAVRRADDFAYKMVNKVAAERDALQRRVGELEAAGAKVVAGFDLGIFVRSIDGDGDASWAVRLLPHVQALGMLTSPTPEAQG